MPKVTIWIRTEDYSTWQAIVDKPAWLHRAINTKNMLDNIDLDKTPKMFDYRKAAMVEVSDTIYEEPHYEPRDDVA